MYFAAGLSRRTKHPRTIVGRKRDLCNFQLNFQRCRPYQIRATLPYFLHCFPQTIPWGRGVVPKLLDFEGVWAWEPAMNLPSPPRFFLASTCHYVTPPLVPLASKSSAPHRVILVGSSKFETPLVLSSSVSTSFSGQF